MREEEGEGKGEEEKGEEKEGEEEEEEEEEDEAYLETCIEVSYIPTRSPRQIEAFSVQGSRFRVDKMATVIF